MNPNHVQTLVLDWLSRSEGAKLAFQKSVEENLFPKDDMIFALQHLRAQMQENQLEKWAEKSEPKRGVATKTLFLHAGNLPLVGFQDVLAALISGVNYVGKISKSDPHFISNFLDFVATETGKKFTYSTSLEELSDERPFENVVFSGSESSSQEVVLWLKENDFVDKSTRYLIRTAHVSVFYSDEIKEAFLPELSQAMFRYQNKGCRNVGIIICKNPLQSQSCLLTDNVELYWMRSGVDFPKNELQRTYSALHSALGLPQVTLSNVSIVQTEPDLSVPQTIFYVHGGEEELTRIIFKFGAAIQSVYTQFGDSIAGIVTESISKAQTPDIWWQPDGVDILSWLTSK